MQIISHEALEKIEPEMVTVIGIPWDENSSFMRGPAKAPRRIRKILHNGSANLCAENGIDLSDSSHFMDLGDIDISNGEKVIQEIESAISDLLDQGVYVLSLGGDHAVTYPVLKAYGRHYNPISILHFDAHPDLYDEYEGNRYAHGCPFARIMEEKLAGRLVQVGIRTMNPHQRKQAEKFNVEVIDMTRWKPGQPIKMDGPVYISLDLDALDPAYAPGVSHHEPGGMSTRDVIRIIQNLNVPIVGADIVELNPDRDINDVTAMVSAKLLKEIAGTMIRQNELKL